MSSFDWTRHPSIPVSDHCQFLRQYDWASTTLGSMEEWPALLRQYVCQIMVHPAPRVLCWGEKLALIYNEPAVPLISQMGKHPDSLGQPMALYWGELLEQGLQAMFDQVMICGKAAMVENLYLGMHKASQSSMTGSPESTRKPQTHDTYEPAVVETYFSFTLIPIFDADGAVVGLLDEVTETTPFVISDRRLATILRIEDNIAKSQCLHDVWQDVLAGLEQNVQDVPFALLYSGNNDSTVESATHRSVLEGAIGLPADHHIGQLNLPHAHLAPYIEEAWNSGKPIITKCSNLLPQQRAENSSDTKSKGHTESEDHRLIIPGRGHDWPVSSAMVLPIPRLSQTGQGPIGILVLAMNPQRPYDTEYQDFIHQLTESLVRCTASISVPEEQRRQQQATQEMAREHAKISSYLMARTQEAERTGATFKRLTESAPVGMGMFAQDGKAIWVNQVYTDHLGLTKDELTPKTWKNSLHPDDHEIVDKSWETLQEGHCLPLVELRIKKQPSSDQKSTGGDDEYNYILAGPSVMLDEHGKIESIIAWTLDISHQKNAERLQAERLQDVLEAKRQSENFIDMTSHEMRNPLSAIFQSADSILAMMGDKEQKGNLSFIISHNNFVVPKFKPYPSSRLSKFSLATVDGLRLDLTKMVTNHAAIVDAAHIISLCAQHQKRIVDDLLTLSKLDAKLLLIAPEKVQPVNVLQKMLQMYTSELRNADVQADLVEDPTINDMAIEEVIIDPGRLLQVLINIFTNAIKFTKDSATRRITLTLSASYSRPTEGPYGASYVPFHFTPAADKDRGEDSLPSDTPTDTIFLRFSLEDTGRGLSQEEMGILFQRFAQASPKTYGQYGGSGLGLFISRELTELQGGQIGVHSILGKGTTFFCYIKAKRYRPRDDTPKGNRRATSVQDTWQQSKRRKQSADLLTPGRRIPNFSDAGEYTPPQPFTIGKLSVAQSLPSTPPAYEFQGQQIHVLIVEDNEINQRVLSQQLTREGCICDSVNHGGEAIDFLLKSIFAVHESSLPPTSLEGIQLSPQVQYKELSVVLLDVEMPIMDGLTAVRRIRELEREGQLARHVPIIAVTANARQEHVADALEAGMDFVVTKPFRISELMVKMRQCIGEASARMHVEVESSPTKRIECYH